MSDLQRVVERVGHGAVRTHLRSGNVVFRADDRDARRIATELEQALQADLNLDSRVVVRSASELDAVVATNPFPEALELPSNLHVVFLDGQPDAAFMEAFDHDAIAPDQVVFAGREIYVWYRNGMAGSKLGDNPWRRVGATSTDRNWNTVTKLAAMAAEV